MLNAEKKRKINKSSAHTVQETLSLGCSQRDEVMRDASERYITLHVTLRYDNCVHYFNPMSEHTGEIKEKIERERWAQNR